MANFNNYEDEMLKVIGEASKTVAHNFANLKKESLSSSSNMNNNGNTDSSSLQKGKVLERVRVADNPNPFATPVYSDKDYSQSSSYGGTGDVSENPFTNSNGSSFVVAFLCTVTVILVIGIVCLRLFGIL